MVLTKEERRYANWKAMVNWWGLPDDDGNHRPPAESNFREEEEKEFLLLSEKTDRWGPTERVLQISSLFFRDKDEEEEEYQGDITPEIYEGLLNELIGYAERMVIDVADELDALDALQPLLLKVMDTEHAAIRAKAAELVSAMVHNNPTGQQFVMEAKGLRPLMHNFTSDPDVTARIKALEAISSLIRDNKPGISEFLMNDGFPKLADALTSESVMLRREAYNLIQYVLHVSSMSPIDLGAAMALEDLGAARQVRQHVDPPGPDRISLSKNFGSFFFLAAVESERERGLSPAAVACSKHITECVLLRLSTSSTKSVSKSGSSTGLWWPSTPPNYVTVYAEEEKQADYDDQVFTVDTCYNTNLLGGGGGGSTSNDDQHQQLVFELESLGFPQCFRFRDNYSFIEIVGSCDGLVCLYDREDERNDVSLWNPTTKEFKCLPKSITFDKTCPEILVAFGFDVQTKDYKVLLVTCFNPRYYRTVAPVECRCKVQVYSLSTNSWRLLEGIKCLPGFPEYGIMEGSALYLNGSCFFMASFFYTKLQRCFSENNRFIISFDFTKEIFIPMQLPDHHKDQDLYLCSLADKIAIFIGAYYVKDDDNNDIWVRNREDEYVREMSQIFGIWVLNEHISNSNICSVNKKSWIKLYSFRIEPERPGEWILPRGISADGKFAMLETKNLNGVGKKMKLYNLVTNEVKKNFLSCSRVMSKANAYKPSIVRLNMW